MPFFANAQIKSFKSISSPVIENEIHGFGEGKKGEIYLYDSGDKLYVFRNDSVIKLNFSCFYCGIEDIVMEGEDSLLIMTTYEGLFRYNNNKATLLNPIERYSAVAVDNKGVLYIGSADNTSNNLGLGKSIDRGKTFTFTKQSTNGLPNNIIHEIKIDKNNSVWMANWEGIVRLKSGVFKKFADSDLSPTFYSLDISDDDVVWGVSAFGGLARVRNETINDYRKYFNPFASVGGVGIDSKGYAWTYEDKLFRISDVDSLQFPMSRFDRESNIPRALFIDSKDRLWISFAYDNRPLVIQLDYTSATKDIKESTFTMTPNPASDQLKITSVDKNVDMIELFDMRGQKLLNQIPEAGRVDVSTVPSGLYFIRIYSGQDVVVGKVVVE